MFETGFLAIVLLVAGVIVLFKTVRMVPQGDGYAPVAPAPEPAELVAEVSTIG